MTKTTTTSPAPVRRQVQSWETAHADHKRRPAPFLDEALSGREQAATSLATDLSLALATEIEELCTHHHEFRIGMHRAFMRVLSLASRQEQQVVVFNEAIPGFTVLLFKKEPADPHWQPPKVTGPTAHLPPIDSPEIEAASVLIERFVANRGSRVLVIEGDDAIFVFFPVADLRKNLREMGFYHTGV